MKSKFVLCSVLIIVLTACIVGTGCTSTQSAQSSAQNVPPTIITTSQPLDPTNIPATTAASIAQTTVPVVAPSTTQNPASNGLIVTLNSAVKKTKVGTSTPRPDSGNVFLVLDITIQNNDQNNDFEYTDTTFKIVDKTNKKTINPITNQVAGGLNNPFTTGSIPLKSQKMGQIVFPVPENSNNYKFTISDPTGTIISTIDNIKP